MHSERAYWADRQHTEWCGAMVDSLHVNMHKLARRFGLRFARHDRRASAARARHMLSRRALLPDGAKPTATSPKFIR